MNFIQFFLFSVKITVFQKQTFNYAVEWLFGDQLYFRSDPVHFWRDTDTQYQDSFDELLEYL